MVARTYARRPPDEHRLVFFLTADVARLAAGGYTVIETNDGGCSVLPERMDPRDLDRAMLA
jgi:hypothetical protein